MTASVQFACWQTIFERYFPSTQKNRMGGTVPQFSSFKLRFSQLATTAGELFRTLRRVITCINDYYLPVILQITPWSIFELFEGSLFLPVYVQVLVLCTEVRDAKVKEFKSVNQRLQEEKL